MLAVRRLLAQRYFAVLLCAATLLLKLLVPAGYMIGSEQGRITIALCSGVAPPAMMMAMPEVATTMAMPEVATTMAMPEVATTMAMPEMHADMPHHGKSQDHGKAEMPCAFAGLSAASLGAIDPVQLVALILFVMTVGLSPSVLPTILRQCHLRPPLRGPPAAL